MDSAPAAGAGLVAARDGKVRVLAVTGAQRSKAAPRLPMVADFLPRFQITPWGSLLGPARMPPAVVQQLSALTWEALRDPELNRRIKENGATTWFTTPDDPAAFRGAQQRRFAELIRASGAKLPAGG